GGEGWGEEARFYWCPLSSFLSPFVPRGERMQSLMQPWSRPNHREARDSMPEKTNPEDDLFEAALLRSPGPERAAFLDAECRSNPELRARVGMMLEGHLNAKDFLETLPNRVAPEREIASPAGLEQVGGNIGPYKLLQKLGEGGCGVVYLAEQN